MTSQTNFSNSIPNELTAKAGVDEGSLSDKYDVARNFNVYIDNIIIILICVQNQMIFLLCFSLLFHVQIGGTCTSPQAHLTSTNDGGGLVVPNTNTNANTKLLNQDRDLISKTLEISHDMYRSV